MKRPESNDRKVNEYIDFLEKELQAMRESPCLESYLTMKAQIEDWNAQLKIGGKVQRCVGEDEETGQPIYEDRIKGEIDLFSDKDDKSFDRTFKYFDKIVALHEQLDKLFRMMSPEQQAEAKKKEKLSGTGIAEKIALGNS